MRRAWLAVVALLIVGAPAARAQYLFMQYTMLFKKQQPNQPGSGNPQQPMSPNQPGGQGPAGDAEFEAVPVNAVVEIKSYNTVPNFAQQRIKGIVKQQWGTSTLYNDDQIVTQAFLVQQLPNVHVRYAAKKDSLSKKRTNEGVFELAEFCLEHGLANEFAGLMDEVAASGKKTGLDKLDRAVEAYTQVKAALAGRIDREEASAYWRAKLGFRMSQSDHYSLLYNAALNDPPEVQQRLKALEDNMRGVYYWFVMKGIPLPVPNQKLVAVLLDQPDQFTIQRALIEDEPLVSDGFFSPRDNVVVFSAQRLDDASVKFAKQMQGYYQQGWDRDSLLKGDKTSKLAGKRADERERMSTLALLDKAMDMEGERAAVTHEGTRQLFVGAGLQKPAVVMPDWFQFGMASVFETPKGPYPAAPVQARVAYWPGYGAPSWKYTRLFRLLELDSTKEAEFSPFRSRARFGEAGRTLERVVSDVDFGTARDMVRFAPPRVAERSINAARSYAWALCYFLARQRTPGVMRFYEELSKMPRDLEPQPNDILACFFRAFDVADTTGSKMDPAKFEELAKDWLGYMKTVRTPGAEYTLEAPPNPAAAGPAPPAPPGPGAGKGGGKGGGGS